MSNIEQRILDSAKAIFVEKGYEGTSIRDIATEAKVNVAMVNYYFRSKENLFQQIFMDVYGTLLNKAIEEEFENPTLYRKIELLVSFILDNVAKSPRLPLFVLTEINRESGNLVNDEFLRGIQQFFNFFEKQIQDEINARNIRPINPTELFINIVSMCIFPFLGLPVLERVFESRDYDVSPFIDARKEQIMDFVMNSIKIS